MQNVFIEYVYLILIILLMVMIANKLRIAYPIVLVLCGLILSFLFPFSHVSIDPNIVFFIFLPPLLYEAAWQTSWKEFWRWRRVIMSFAFPIVILTSTVVAFASNALIPGFTLALGFLLGGIISPPDAISAVTIMRRVKIPKTLVSIIEGESLLNDASSLIVFRFALAAVITGQFHFQDAALNFFLVIIMGTMIGLFIALVFYCIHRYLPTTPSIDIVLTLVAPYCMYYFAETFHFSGVLAVVSGGLLLSAKRQSMLSYRSRLEGVNFWNSLVFVLNGLIFLLIGLQLPFITSQLGDFGVEKAIWYGLGISFLLIITRFACTFGASLFTRFISRYIKVADPEPGFKGPIILGWAGMRGVVSLAAALSIPLYINNQPFPYRNLILFITFIVILVTLVLQGLTLPWVISKVNVEDKFATMSEKEQEKAIQKKICEDSMHLLQHKYNGLSIQNERIRNLFEKLSIDLNIFEKQALSNEKEGTRETYQRIYLELLEQQRKTLVEFNRRPEFNEELIRKYLSLIDLEEYKLREKYQNDNHSQ